MVPKYYDLCTMLDCSSREESSHGVYATGSLLLVTIIGLATWLLSYVKNYMTTTVLTAFFLFYRTLKGVNVGTITFLSLL